MNEKLFDALETCLQALENGETLDAALARFPALAADLRPMLEASLHAQTLGGSPPSDAIQRRGRARLLQRAAEMRESKRSPRRTWLFNFRPLAVALMLVVFFLSGTGLVNASTTSLPGDNLYPVKRTWEDMRLLFAFGEGERKNLELEYEDERQEEINELLAEGRMEPISFSGYVTAQSDGQWKVSGIPVLITAQTALPTEPVNVGSVVTVFGVTTSTGAVDAQRVNLVPPGTPIPTPKPEDENESEGGEEDGGDDEGGDTRPETDSGSSSDNEAEDDGEDSSSGEKIKVTGVVESINGTTWIVDGQMVNVSGAEIVGTPAPGAEVTIEGYVDANGVFIATKVIFGEGDGNGGSEGDSDLSDDNSGDSSDDDSSDDDSDGGDDESDSGGGGDDQPDDD